MPNLRKSVSFGKSLRQAFKSSTQPQLELLLLPRVQLRKTENTRPMDCTHRGSNRGVVPYLLDAVGVCCLTCPQPARRQQREHALSMVL
jgi:hypothetical protein